MELQIIGTIVYNETKSKDTFVLDLRRPDVEAEDVRCVYDLSFLEAM